MSLYDRRFFTWRQQFNILRALTIQRAIFYLEMAERGFYSDLNWIYRFIEKRDATLRAVLFRRQSAIKKLDWSVKIKEESADDKTVGHLAEEQQQALKECYSGIDNLKAAMAWLERAEFRGFAHLEKHYRNGMPAEGVYHLELVPQWHWARKMPDARWRFNELAFQTNDGIIINPQDFIVREVESPINEIALIFYLRKAMSQKDWDAFVETYGLPPLFIELPPEARITDRETYQEMAEQIIGDMRGTLPPGAKVQTLPIGDRHDNPFKGHQDNCDEAIVLAATSGKLTVLSDRIGFGGGQSKVHADTFRDLAQAEGLEISEIFQTQFDLLELERLFPGQDVHAYFELQVQEETNLQSYIEDTAVLAAAGYVTDEEDVSEKTGRTVTRAPAQGGQQGPGGKGATISATGLETASGLVNRASVRRAVRQAVLRPDPRLQKESLDEVCRALAQDLTLVRNRVQAIKLIDDIELRNQKLRQLVDELPNLITDMTRDPTSARALEESLVGAFSDGITARGRA